MFADPTILPSRDTLADRARFVHFPLFLKEMKASNWRAAKFNLLATFGFLADDKLRLADLAGIDLRRPKNNIQAEPKKLHTRGQLRLIGSRPASLNPTAAVETKIRAAFREKGIDAETPLNELFAVLAASGERKKNLIERLAANVADLIGEPAYALRQNNVVPLFPNRGGETPAPQ